MVFYNKKISVSLILMFLSCFTHYAHATCTRYLTNPINETTLNFGTIIADNDAAIGSVLATATVPATHNSYLTCGAPYIDLYSMLVMFTEASTTVDNTMQTNLPGVGIRIEVPKNTVPTPSTPTGPYIKYVNDTTYNQSRANINSDRKTGLASYNVELVKTGPITGGELTSGWLLRTVSAISASTQYTMSRLYIGGGTIVSQSCKVDNNVINVTMNDVMDTDFNGLGSTTPEVSFNIPLQCEASQKVTVKLSAGASGGFDSAKGILNLDTVSDSTVAEGVGLQILFNNNPVPFETDLSVGTSTVGAYNIPFTARYYQTGAKVSAGIANASASVLLTYE
ncbi:fimbrial protein [Enterobacter huaxiensis]|uniref:fimbrial protein n=1 Tax=Enterobacter huaxiensis TaxID=2494702 RepID=UPI000E756622|nr:fimbrial protein [Enterobacter huaxiensis]UNC52645.1 fimbrial protein [Enterobacter huaxiensis]